MDYILQVKNAIKYYSNGTVTTKALNGVSFDVQKGEFVAVMGASGSGKSTLLNAIATIEPLSGGDILVDRVSLSELKESELAAFRRNKLGFHLSGVQFARHAHRRGKHCASAQSEKNKSYRNESGGDKSRLCARRDAAVEKVSERAVGRRTAAGGLRKSGSDQSRHYPCRRTDGCPRLP